MKDRQWDAGDFVAWIAAIVGLITLAIAIPWALSERENTSPCSGQKLSDYAPTTSRLVTVYREANEDYFFGSLPFRKTTVTLGDLSEHGWLAHIEQRQDGTWLIVIDTKGNPTQRQADMSLIHEMCHQYVYILHKPVGLDDEEIQSCMINVANQGGFRDRW